MMAERIVASENKEFPKISINYYNEPGDHAMVQLAPFVYDN